MKRVGGVDGPVVCRSVCYVDIQGVRQVLQVGVRCIKRDLIRKIGTVDQSAVSSAKEYAQLPLTDNRLHFDPFGCRSVGLDPDIVFVRFRKEVTPYPQGVAISTFF